MSNSTALAPQPHTQSLDLMAATWAATTYEVVALRCCFPDWQKSFRLVSDFFVICNEKKTSAPILGAGCQSNAGSWLLVELRCSVFR